MEVKLSTCEVPKNIGIERESPRPKELRTAHYNEQFDWHTIFYDVYRVGTRIVFHGPPLFNLLEYLKQSTFFRQRLSHLRSKLAHVNRELDNQLWFFGLQNSVEFDGPLGSFSVTVQPNMSYLFENKRTLLTISKNNQIDWIRDWILFHARVQKADAALIYDNGSTEYSVAELQAKLKESLGDLVVQVVSWPFKWGPGREWIGDIRTPLNSKYAQFGMLNHARFRFLNRARSVLNCDIDEFVVSKDGLSIFEETEKSVDGYLHIGGHWIVNHREPSMPRGSQRHYHFSHYDPTLPECSVKWCIQPSNLRVRRHDWRVHNVRGLPNLPNHPAFKFRHFKAITTNWKPADRLAEIQNLDHLIADADLIEAFKIAGFPVGGFR